MGKKKEAFFWLVIAFFLFLPQMASGPFTFNQLPRVNSGDEPHYLVILNSIIKDHDLNVANNYLAASQGGNDAGKWFRNKDLDHHSTIVFDDTRYYWPDVFHANYQPKKGFKDKAPPTTEFPTHQFGLPLILTTTTFLFRNTAYVEVVALLSILMLSVALLFVLKKWLSNENNGNWVILSLALGTPFWHYSRALFTENILALIFLAGFYLFFKKNHMFLSSLVLGFSLIVKVNAVVVFIPLGIYLLLKKRYSCILKLASTVPVYVGTILYFSNSYLGSPLEPPQIARFDGNIFEGISGLLWSKRAGLLLYTPVSIVALWGWIKLLKRPIQNDEHRVIFSFICLWLLMSSTWHEWWAGYCFGPRYLVPILPFLFIGLSGLKKLEWGSLNTRNFSFKLILSVSILINYLGAVPYWKYWSKHPFFN